MTITITGEEGKALGPSEMNFSEVASAGSLSFDSLSVDEFNFTIEPEFLDARESEIPEEGQTVSLFFNGERVFVGVVTRIRNDWGEGSLSIEVTVSGAWWWLEQIALSELVDVGTESESDRPQFRCPLGEVEGHIERLFARVKELGAPVDLGEVAPCYAIPTTTFRDASFGRALSELLRMVPDAIGWFDYSGTGNPRFRVSRRDTLNAEAFTLGSCPVISGTLEAEFGLKVDRVSIPFAERLETGVTAYREQKAGGTSGTRQVFPVSGPELVDFVPPDPIDGIQVTTVDVGGAVNLNIQSLWQFWADWQLRHPAVTSLLLQPWISTSTSEPHTFFNGIDPAVYLEDGTALTGGDNQNAIAYVPNQTVPNWIDELYEVQRGYINGTFYVFIADAPGDDPTYVTELLEAASSVTTITGGADNGDRYLFFGLEEVPVVLLPVSLTDSNLFKPLAYEFETPPANFAKNLQEAQSWLPYSGSLSLDLDGQPFSRRSGQTVNVENGRPSWANMGALVKGEQIDLFGLTHSLQLGVPDRLSGTSPVTRLERSSSDSVVLL